MDDVPRQPEHTAIELRAKIMLDVNAAVFVIFVEHTVFSAMHLNLSSLALSRTANM